MALLLEIIKRGKYIKHLNNLFKNNNGILIAVLKSFARKINSAPLRLFIGFSKNGKKVRKVSQS
jgi:hypothetical protein